MWIFKCSVFVTAVEPGCDKFQIHFIAGAQKQNRTPTPPGFGGPQGYRAGNTKPAKKSKWKKTRQPLSVLQCLFTMCNQISWYLRCLFTILFTTKTQWVAQQEQRRVGRKTIGIAKGKNLKQNVTKTFNLKTTKTNQAKLITTTKPKIQGVGKPLN